MDLLQITHQGVVVDVVVVIGIGIVDKLNLVPRYLGTKPKRGKLDLNKSGILLQLDLTQSAIFHEPIFSH